MLVKDTQKLIQKISDTNLPNEKKSSLTAIIDRLPFQMFRLVNKKINSSSGFKVANTVLQCQQAFDNMLNGNNALAISIFEQGQNFPESEDGEYLIPFAQDARQIAINNPENSESLLNALDIFESKVFNFLPETELIEILKGDLVNFVRLLPIVLEFKRAYYLVELSDDGSWISTLRKSLEDSKEILGQTGLTREGKNYPQTIGNWLKDYGAYINKPISQRAAFDQVQYIERAPNVQRLTEQERKDLLEIIKLHAWFMNPLVSEEEIENYEKEPVILNEQKVKIPEAPVKVWDVKGPATSKSEVIYKKETIAEKELHAKSVGIQNFPSSTIPPQDWVTEATKRKMQDQQKINQKLQDLKSRTNT